MAFEIIQRLVNVIDRLQQQFVGDKLDARLNAMLASLGLTLELALGILGCIAELLDFAVDRRHRRGSAAGRGLGAIIVAGFALRNRRHRGNRGAGRRRFDLMQAERSFGLLLDLRFGLRLSDDR